MKVEIEKFGSDKLLVHVDDDLFDKLKNINKVIIANNEGFELISVDDVRSFEISVRKVERE